MGATSTARGRWPALVAAASAALALAACGGDDAGETEAPEGPAPFGYGADDGPERWGELDPAYAACSQGTRQSPVDLAGAEASSLPDITVSYEAAEVEAEDNGHSVEVDYPAGSSIEVDGTSYALEQFHFHAPSEHTVDGRSFPMELHLVHRSANEELAVLGVLVEEGVENESLVGLARALPEGEGQVRTVPDELDAAGLLPPGGGEAERWSYDGSLTTPPCTEGVAWHVFREPIEASRDQLDAFTGVYSQNNRPVQPLGGRDLLVGR